MSKTNNDRHQQIEYRAHPSNVVDYYTSVRLTIAPMNVTDEARTVLEIDTPFGEPPSATVAGSKAIVSLCGARERGDLIAALKNLVELLSVDP